jgi:hypothetical protein
MAAAIPIAVSNLAPAVTKKRRKRTFTLEQRKAQAAKMGAYWAAKRKANKK